MKNIKLKQQNGSITLIMVFFTTTILFLLVFADHLNAMKEKTMAQSDVQTEQAFYASQSGLEEAYLQLRTDENYAASPVTVQVEGVNFKVEKTNVVGKSGQLSITGVNQEKIRTVASAYKDAGVSTTQKTTAIYHILDRSGSMKDDGNGCTVTAYHNQTDCLHHSGVWGLQPITSTKEAAKAFIDKLNPAFDRIGLVFYSTNVNLGHETTIDYPDVKNSIQGLTADGWTYMAGAIEMATSKLVNVTEEVKVEILLTDGKANVTPTCTNCEVAGENLAREKANLAKQAHIILFTIGLGSNVNGTFLSNLASKDAGNNPLYFYAPEASDLDAIYNKIASIINEYKIGQKSWEEK